jgi:hypothetical protein
MSYKNDTGLPSVTEILGPWINTNFFKDEHRERGDAVHTFVKKKLSKLYQIIPDVVKPYAENFCAFVEPHIGRVVLIEERLSSRVLGYTGQLDSVLYHGGELALIDWKSSTSLQWWWPLQLGGYLLLLRTECPDIIVKKVMSISLQKGLDKPPKVRIYLDHDMEQYVSLFESQLKIFKMGGKNHGKSNRIQGDGSRD